MCTSQFLGLGGVRKLEQQVDKRHSPIIVSPRLRLSRASSVSCSQSFRITRSPLLFLVASPLNSKPHPHSPPESDKSPPSSLPLHTLPQLPPHHLNILHQSKMQFVPHHAAERLTPGPPPPARATDPAPSQPTHPVLPEQHGQGSQQANVELLHGGRVGQLLITYPVYPPLDLFIEQTVLHLLELSHGSSAT